MEKTCLHCGDTFEATPKEAGRKYCSASCRKKRWQQDNKDYGLKKMREWRESHPNYLGPKRQAIVDKVNKIKEETPCHDCGKFYQACCMDFDHTRKDKHEEVGYLIAMTKTWDVIKAEIDKCDLVCANCHRVRTKLKGSNGWTRKTIEKDGEPKSKHIA